MSSSAPSSARQRAAARDAKDFEHTLGRRWARDANDDWKNSCTQCGRSIYITLDEEIIQFGEGFNRSCSRMMAKPRAKSLC